jgi:hypothetical protein
VRVRFWRDGAAEPSAWTATATDSFWTSGRASFGVYASSGLLAPFPTTGIRSFRAVDLG